VIELPPIIHKIVRDRQLNGRDVQIWVLAVPRLDFFDFRPLPLSELAEEFKTECAAPLSWSTVGRSLRRLVDRGYLERLDDRGARQVVQYRIPLRRVFPRRPADDLVPHE
jgi:DNA-binding transcriptional ArsR family regulator